MTPTRFFGRFNHIHTSSKAYLSNTTAIQMFLGTLFCLAFLLTLCHAFVSSSSSDGGIQRQHRRKCSSSWSSSSLNAFVSVVRDDTAFNMYYTYVERKQPTNGASRRLPVVTLHGGPGLPSDYLLPLQDAVLHRSMLFYDQLGCGKSDAPRDESKYSIEQSLDDLVALLKSVQEDELGGSDFHLYGHSFGGVLAYEYLKRVSNPTTTTTTTAMTRS